MPSGNTHEVINMVALPPILTFLQPDSIFIFTAGYLFSTFYLSPDLDLPQSKPSQRWGKLKVIWKFYQSIVPHRSFISHTPIISSLIRLAYLFLILSVIFILILLIVDEVFFNRQLLIYLLQGEVNEEFKNLIKIFFLYFTYGVIVADLIHLFLDFSNSFLKRLKKGITKKVKFLKI